MSIHDEQYMDAYDYYQHTGELAECFEDDEYEYEYEYEEETEYEPQNQNTMSNTKLKYLNELTEINDVAATKYGVELKSFVFRNVDDDLILYMEFEAIEGKRHKGDLDINVVLYDKDGDIFDTLSEYILEDHFKGFEVVKFEFCDIQPSDIGRIKIYMRKD